VTAIPENLDLEPADRTEDADATGQDRPSAPLAISFADAFSDRASRLLNTPAAVKPAALQCLSYGQYVGSIEDHSSCWLMNCPAGAVWVEVDSRLAAGLVDLLLGGTGRPAQLGGPLTEIDRTMLAGFVHLAVDLLGATLRTRIEADVEVRQDALQPGGGTRPAQAASATKAGLPGPDQSFRRASFDVRVAGLAGAVRWGLPAELGDMLFAAATSEPAAPPNRPEGAGSKLSVVAPASSISPEQLAGLAAGDVLVTDVEADGEVIVRIDGEARFTGRLGTRNGKKAVVITRPLDDESAEAGE